MTGTTTASGTRRSFVRPSAAALLSGIVLAGCGAPAEKAAAPGETPQSLAAKVLEVEHALYVDAIRQYADRVLQHHQT